MVKIAHSIAQSTAQYHDVALKVECVRNGQRHVTNRNLEPTVSEWVGVMYPTQQQVRQTNTHKVRKGTQNRTHAPVLLNTPQYYFNPSIS
jgi:hypothetical protein